MILTPARKVCLCCIAGSCIGVAVLSGFPTNAELGFGTPGQKQRLGETMAKHEHMGESKSWSVRSVVACGLLLLVLFINIKAMSASLVEDGKFQGRTMGGSFSSVKTRMRKMSQPVLSSPFFWYTVVVLGVIVAYIRLFTTLKKQGYRMTPPDWSLFASAAGEGFGIIWLRSRIRKYRHVQGISAKSVTLIAMLYFDTACTFPAWRSQQLDVWACKVLEVISLLLVLDVLYSILVTHRRTYQNELDVFPVKALVFVCAVLAFVYQPKRVNLHPCSVAFTFRIYVDTFALVPQVVMMSMQERPVHAPIAHFVAVNATSRMLDLMYWLSEYKFFAGPLNVSFSGWLVVLVHVASLLVVADFFYYYIKMWIVSRGFVTEMPIPAMMEM